MSKLLVLLAVLALAYALWRNGQRRSRPPAPPAKRPPTPQAMVACARCGVHLPDADALHADGDAYCCPAHRDQGPS